MVPTKATEDASLLTTGTKCEPGLNNAGRQISAAGCELLYPWGRFLFGQQPNYEQYMLQFVTAAPAVMWRWGEGKFSELSGPIRASAA